MTNEQLMSRKRHIKRIEPNGKNLALEIKCPMCHRTFAIGVNAASFESWKDGTLIQTAFPEMSVDHREMLISGFDDTCFKRICGVA